MCSSDLTRQTLSPSLEWHFHLLGQLLGEFYVAKVREQKLQQQTYVQAVHETGARVTHDVKNLLQSLNVLCAAAERVAEEPHCVAALRAVVVEAWVADTLVELDVLCEGSPEVDVQQLRTATDPEERYPVTDRSRDNGKFPLVALGFGSTEARVGLVAVEAGVYVGAAADDHPVETLHHLVDIGITRQLHR